MGGRTRFYAVSMVVALGRSVQLYVYAAFSPIPISLLGFDETKQIGIGYLKNFAAAASQAWSWFLSSTSTRIL